MRTLLCLLAIVTMSAQAEDRYAGIGRSATPAEIQAWDIDVRPDFKGLPPGSGSVAKGQQVWESKCETCHGIFGESTDVFSPIVGGTSKDDIRTGRVASLLREDYPQRTTLMKVSTLSTLWDYINRAMPWNAPKSLSTEEVYAVTAYILHLGDILPADFVLSDKNIRDVQQRLPNRNGKLIYEALWRVRGKGDTNNTLCMKDCVQEMQLASNFPDYARNAHGNIAEQNRLIGPVRGTDTTLPPGAGMQGRSGLPAIPAQVAAKPAGPAELLQKYSCSACHQVDRKFIGPGFVEVAARYRGKADAEAVLMAKIRKGGSGVWGSIPMPPNPQVPDEELRVIVRWALSGATP
jgi:cytochrome c